MLYNRIPITIGEFQLITGPTVSYQYDIEQYLVFNSVTLPDYYTVDFCNVGDAITKPVTGDANGVRIPDEYLKTGRKVKAYIMITGDDEGAVQTRYEITIPVHGRPARSDIQPTPEERLEIDTLVDALNDGVGRAEQSATNASISEANAEESAIEAEHWAEVAQQGAEESGYAWFDVHDDDGCMYVYISDNLSEDVSFAVDEAAGILEVTYH